MLLTKADKLNRREADAALAGAQAGARRDVAGESADVGVTLFSALTRRGVGRRAEALHGWTRT